MELVTMGTKTDHNAESWLDDIDSIDPFASMELNFSEGSPPPQDDEFITPEAVQVKVEVNMACPYCFLQFMDQMSLEEHVELCPKSIQDDNNEEDDIQESPELRSNQELDPIEPIVSSSNGTLSKKSLITSKISRRYTCQICSAKFRYSHHLTRHFKVHSNTTDRPHKCNICSASFASSYQLTRHKLIHGTATTAIRSGLEITELKQAQYCELCLTAFSSRRNFDVHKKIHLGQKPYKCGECMSTWKTKDELMGHMRKHTQNMTGQNNVNPTSKPTIPRMPPGISISPISKLTTPKKIQRPTPAAIPISFLTPNFRNNNNNHLTAKSSIQKLKSSTQPKPSVQPKLKTASKILMKKKGKGKFVCEVCGKNFQRGHHLTRHRLIHTGERPHKCKWCDKSYSRKEHLTAHLKTHDSQSGWVSLDSIPVVELIPEDSDGLAFEEEDSGEIVGI